MTLEEFVATKTWCDDLGAKLSDARWEETKAKGWLYLDALYIEQLGDKWSLLIGRYERVDVDLAPLELELWKFAKSEGYCD